MKKILIFLIVFVAFLSIMLISIGAYNLNNETLYSKEEYVNLLKYDGIKIGTYFVVYNKDGVEYPAYCVEREKPGVGESGDSYTVDASELVSNLLVWKVATNGYPYKTPQQLGCQSIAEAYIATKLAIYDVLYNYEYEKFEAINESGERILNSMKNISNVARNSDEVKISSDITIVPENTNWQIDENDSRYIYKTYSITVQAPVNKYSISIQGQAPEDIQILDIQNNIKNEFEQNDKFKIRIPIMSLTQAGEFNIKVEGSVKTKPIFYGRSPSNDKQSYILTASEFEDGTGSIKEKYIENNTKIKILKLDGETLETLKDAEFELLDENKNIIYVELKTNEQGITIIENLLPGKYYLRETRTNEGYIIYNDLIEINLNLNEELTIKVNNFKEKETKIEVIKNTVEVSEQNSTLQVTNNQITSKIKLPKTGY